MHCGAKTRSGGTCRNAPMANGRCRLHGGMSLAGPASPQWIDGRRSKVLPKRLLADYQAGRDDPNRLALFDEIDLIDARMNDLLKRVDSGESGQLWQMLKTTAREYELARKSRDPDAMAQAIALMLDLINRGHADAAAWSEVAGLIERRRKLAESERKRLVEAQQMISVEQAMALMGLLVEAVQRYVRDDDALAGIVHEYSRLVGRPVPVAPPAPIASRAGPRRGAG